MLICASLLASSEPSLLVETVMPWAEMALRTSSELMPKWRLRHVVCAEAEVARVRAKSAVMIFTKASFVCRMLVSR